MGPRPPTRALFGENVCERERIGSRWRREARPLDPPVIMVFSTVFVFFYGLVDAETYNSFYEYVKGQVQTHS